MHLDLNENGMQETIEEKMLPHTRPSNHFLLIAKGNQKRF